MGAGLLTLAVLLAGAFTAEGRNPLYGVLVLLAGVPAALPAACGFFMARGKAWAAWALRISISATLAAGFLLQGQGLDVFSHPVFAAAFIGAGAAWVALSFL